MPGADTDDMFARWPDVEAAGADCVDPLCDECDVRGTKRRRRLGATVMSTGEQEPPTPATTTDAPEPPPATSTDEREPPPPATATVDGREPPPPLFTLGLMADVQSADKPDAAPPVIAPRELRCRSARARLGSAVDFWSAQEPRPVAVLNLGGTVDGRDDSVTTQADLDAVLREFGRLPAPTHHVVGNNCLKQLPRDALLRTLRLSSAYYSAPLAAGWRLLVLDTTELSTHGGWAAGSPQDLEARAYLAAHAGEERMKLPNNGGVGAEQMAWLRSELARARHEAVRLIVASHHPLARGACDEVLRSWTGDEVAALLAESPAVAVVLAGHDHVGGYVRWRGTPFVTLEALLEVPEGENAYGLLKCWPDRVAIDGCGTRVTSRELTIGGGDDEEHTSAMPPAPRTRVQL